MSRPAGTASPALGLWLRDTGVHAPAPVRARDPRQAARRQPTKLYCAQCRAPITDTAARVERRGRHDHVFANPEGIAFHIGCFAEAPGCRSLGAATDHWTWFPGFRWQVAVCAGCGAHLGWRYTGGSGAGFFGLILAHLVERSERP